MGGPCSTNGEKRNAYRLLVGKPEGKRPLGRSRRRWVYNTRCGRNNSHISKGDYEQKVRDITKNFYFPNVDIKMFFVL
jgi:hypothetical protein